MIHSMALLDTMWQSLGRIGHRSSSINYRSIAKIFLALAKINLKASGHRSLNAPGGRLPASACHRSSGGSSRGLRMLIVIGTTGNVVKALLKSLSHAQASGRSPSHSPSTSPCKLRIVTRDVSAFHGAFGIRPEDWDVEVVPGSIADSKAKLAIPYQSQ